MWIHGGGWISGSKEHARGYFKLLAAQGYNVVSVQYQFAPQAIYPSQLHQIDQALEFITQHAAEYQIDAQNLYLAGDSAGANMVSHYAALLTNPAFAKQSDFHPYLQPSQLKGLILHCGIYDLESFASTAPDEIKIVEWGVYNLIQAYTGDRKMMLSFSNVFLQSSILRHLIRQYSLAGQQGFSDRHPILAFYQSFKSAASSSNRSFYPESKAWLIHEYQFFMGKKESQQTFIKTLDFCISFRPST